MRRGDWRIGAFVLMLCFAPCAVANAQSPAFADQICRRYAEAQRAQPVEVMYAQCMYARGYAVPGYSPSPNSPGYQGPLLGPATIGGGS
jgi:hypothetical protein